MQSSPPGPRLAHAPAAFNNVFGFRPSWGRVPSGGDELFLGTISTEGPMGGGLNISAVDLQRASHARADWYSPRWNDHSSNLTTSQFHRPRCSHSTRKSIGPAKLPGEKWIRTPLDEVVIGPSSGRPAGHEHTRRIWEAGAADGYAINRASPRRPGRCCSWLMLRTGSPPAGYPASIVERLIAPTLACGAASSVAIERARPALSALTQAESG